LKQRARFYGSQCTSMNVTLSAQISAVNTWRYSQTCKSAA